MQGIKVDSSGLNNYLNQIFKMGSWKKKQCIIAYCLLLVFYFFHNYYFNQ